MDVSSTELLGTVTEQKVAQKDVTSRHLLVHSEKNNAILATHKPRLREVVSRYKSPVLPPIVTTAASPRQSPSPNAGRNSPFAGASLAKRSQSAERSRPSISVSRHSAPSSPTSRSSTPSTPSSRSTTPVRDSGFELRNASRRSGRAHDGLWPSTRCLATSFQSESVSVPVNRKQKLARDSSPDHMLKSYASVSSERKRTPLRGRNTSDQSENSRLSDNSHSRMVEHHRWPSINSGKLSINTLSRSMDLSEKVNRSTSSTIPVRGVSPRRTSVSDSSGRGLQLSRNDLVKQAPSNQSGKVECSLAAGVHVFTNSSERAASLTRPSRTQSSPVPAIRRPSSPNRALLTSSLTSRGTQSPSRTRPSTPFSSSSTMTNRTGVPSSALNCIDTRKGKKTANEIADVHQLRLLDNRNLQWRFVNALLDAVSVIQKKKVEQIKQSSLYTVWNTTSELHMSVMLKRINLQHLMEEMKLYIILNEQIAYLEEWAFLEKEYSSSLSGAVEALQASTLRLPVTEGARIDPCTFKRAVSSAVDVMQAMGSSVCYLLSQVEGIKHLVSELSESVMTERMMLDECRDLLASIASMQVQESSLRTHLIQLSQGCA